LVLKDRNIIFYSDLGTSEKWSIKAVEIQEIIRKITISTILENEATKCDCKNVLDFAELKSKKTVLKIQSCFCTTLQSKI
jgi:hypothetical protein